MKPILELSYLLAEQLLLPAQESQPTALTAFRPDDVVLMHSVRDEQEWLLVAGACMQPGIRLLLYPSGQNAEQVAKHLREEKVTVLITTGKQWTAIYRQLNREAAVINCLKVVLVDTPNAPEQRYALLPRAFSKARIENTYEAYQKAPWIQATKASR